MKPIPTQGPTVVGIGASAGGLAALKEFFSQVPADSGLAFVVVVHLSPGYESHLAEVLQPHVSCPVEQVVKTTQVLANRVYVIPPNANISTIDTHLRLSPLEEDRRERAPIDYFLRTLASTHDGRSIAVILSGSGSDGVLGVKDIKAQGGLVIVQDPNEAEYDSMPQSAIATGLADRILPVREIAATILRVERTEPKIQIPAEGEEDASQSERLFLQKVLTHLRARTDRDFSRYKQSTILRRIYRRMQLNYIEDLSSYMDRLRENPDEARALADDFLITVTNFFRDKEVFEKLEREIIPKLFEGKSMGDSLRLWSVGCATREEAYSLAMLLLEEASRCEAPPQIQVFASDLHRHSLEKAREGFYAGDIEADVTPDRLRRFFNKESGGYRIRKEVRDLVVFAPHNLLGDPPFSQLDLISCRNLLIYLQRNVQRDVIELFHCALKPEGLLVLGSAETLDATDLFRTTDKRLCLHRKRDVPGPEPRLPVFPLTRVRSSGEAQARTDRTLDPVGYGSLHQRMVEQYAPPSVLVSPDNKVVHLSENAGRFLVHPGGEVTANVFKLIRDELRIDLQAALQTSRERKVIFDSRPIPVQFDGQAIPVVLHVRPAAEPRQDGFALVIFEERGSPQTSGDGLRSGTSDSGQRSEEGRRLEELESELNLAHQRIQTVIEEYETTQEEMKAANEEMQSTNEELRSTMEELETSKEELQSINEELQTVNQENRHKVEELAQLSSDLQNLLVATDIATLFLDRDMRILRFTPKLGELFNVRQTDRGRPISDLTHRLGYQALKSDAESVLTRLVPIEREVRDEEGSWYFARLLPYRSTEDRIEGVVITFFDVTTRKITENELAESERRLRTLLEGIPQLVWRSANNGQWTWASPQWVDFTGLSEARSRDMGWLDAVHPEDRQIARAAWEKTASTGLFDAEYRIRNASDGLYYWHRTRSAPMRDQRGAVVEWLGTSTDIEDLKRAEVIVREAEEKFRLFVENVHEYALLQTDPSGIVTSWNPGAERLFGYTTEETMGRPFSHLTGPDPDRIRALDREIASTAAGKRWEDAAWLTRRDGTRFWARWVSEPVYDDAGRLRGVAKLLRDETERKQAEDRMLMLLGELNHRVKNTLATVQSIANQTLRESSDPALFVNHLQGRLQALSRAHTLLTQSNWDGADVADILREQLAVGDEPGRVSGEGPSARLDAQTSLALAMVLHELGINARKYGALSVDQGRVDVKWSVNPHAGESRLVLEWQESDGPPVSEPTKRGFGSALIERSLGGVGGQAALFFEPEGVRCRIQLTLQAAKDAKAAKAE